MNKKILIFVFLSLSLLIIIGCQGPIGEVTRSTPNKTAGAANYGDLVINVNPLDADLYLDGIYRSRLTSSNTPFTIPGNTFKERTHIVNITKEGYIPFTRQIALAPKKKTTVNAVLRPVTISIDIKSTPPRAKIYLDGRLVGNTPKLLRNLQGTTHNVILSLVNYTNFTQTVTTTPGTTYRLQATLTGG